METAIWGPESTVSAMRFSWQKAEKPENKFGTQEYYGGKRAKRKILEKCPKEKNGKDFLCDK